MWRPGGLEQDAELFQVRGRHVAELPGVTFLQRFGNLFQQLDPGLP